METRAQWRVSGKLGRVEGFAMSAHENGSWRNAEARVAAKLSITRPQFSSEAVRAVEAKSPEVGPLVPEQEDVCERVLVADSASEFEWSPDGMQVAFSRGEPAPGRPAGPRQMSIWTIDVQGGQPRKLGHSRFNGPTDLVWVEY